MLSDEVISGVARPEFRSNLWIGGPGFPQWIELTWQKPVEIRQIHLTFDNDLDRPLSAWAENGHAPALIRNYDIGVAEGEDLRSVVSVADNVARKRIHSIDPVVTRRLRITVNGTWGSDRSRVFELRVY